MRSREITAIPMASMKWLVLFRDVTLKSLEQFPKDWCIGSGWLRCRFKAFICKELRRIAVMFEGCLNSVHFFPFLIMLGPNNILIRCDLCTSWRIHAMQNLLSYFHWYVSLVPLSKTQFEDITSSVFGIQYYIHRISVRKERILFNCLWNRCKSIQPWLPRHM